MKNDNRHNWVFEFCAADPDLIGSEVLDPQKPKGSPKKGLMKNSLTLNSWRANSFPWSLTVFQRGITIKI
jgi:hypothetical protein